MTRTILAIATAFLAVMTVFASAAEACISCEHVPVVVRGSQTSDTATRYKKKRIYRAAKKRKARVAKKRKARPAKKRIVKRKTIAKKVKTAKTAPIRTETDNENSTISTASLDKSEIIDTEETPTDEPKVSRYVGCKKFFPTVGMTLTVPCE
jgi:hypothetical protein